MPASKEPKELESNFSALDSPLESHALDSTTPQSAPLESSLDSSGESTASTNNSDEKPSPAQPKAQKLIDSAYDLSLGISIVVAVLLGLGVGILLQKLSGSVWGLGVGIFWGVGAAILNIYKAYKRTKKDLEALAHDPKYNYEKSKDS